MKTFGCRGAAFALMFLAQVLLPAPVLFAQNAGGDSTPAAAQQNSAALQQRVSELETQVAELRKAVAELQAASRSRANAALDAAPSASAANAEASAPVGSALVSSAAPAATGIPTEQKVSLTPEDRSILDYLRGTTTNVMIDGYYGYNFNNPIGRVNLLRAYDVSSNAFSLNQAAVVFERAPDVEDGRRFGARLDLQYGQATATLQGNPLNEPRPDIYRNVFQAFGTYVAPFAKGWTIDFGKFASSLGLEGNYTKDQINYSRSYWFNYLPFYHMGIRTSLKVNDELALNYWIVNGTNQVEPTNGFKDELFGFVLTPNKNISWTTNYYLGQEHPDRTVVSGCGPLPVQPGLCFQPVIPAPNGKLHILDSYVSWQATPKLLLAAEGDYVIQRLWSSAAPGESSAPSHTTGGAGYIQYQFNPKYALAARAEYLSDRGGLFSGVTEALKEATVTYTYNVTNGFQLRAEWRQDWSNVPVFLTDSPGVYGKRQNTATMGVIWWFGRKQGAW